MSAPEAPCISCTVADPGPQAAHVDRRRADMLKDVVGGGNEIGSGVDERAIEIKDKRIDISEIHKIIIQ